MFNSSAEFGQFLQQLIDRHQQDLSIILNRLGVNRPLDPMTLILTYEKYGDAFIKELDTLPTSSFLGMDESRWKDIFEGGRETVIIKDDKSDETPIAQPEVEKPKLKFWTTKRIVITGLVTIAVLAVVLVIVKKSKS